MIQLFGLASAFRPVGGPGADPYLAVDRDAAEGLPPRVVNGGTPSKIVHRPERGSGGIFLDAAPAGLRP